MTLEKVMKAECWVATKGELGSRGGHGIPKCSLCPSVFFVTTGSVRPFLCVFLGGEYVCPSYGQLKFLKSAKSGRNSVRPFIKKLRNPYFLENLKNKNYCDVIYKMCRVANIVFRISSCRC